VLGGNLCCKPFKVWYRHDHPRSSEHQPIKLIE
jgi:hypothetical protein